APWPRATRRRIGRTWLSPNSDRGILGREMAAVQSRSLSDFGQRGLVDTVEERILFRHVAGVRIFDGGFDCPVLHHASRIENRVFEIFELGRLIEARINGER